MPTYTEQDKAFLSALKEKGVSMEEAFQRLSAVKGKLGVTDEVSDISAATGLPVEEGQIQVTGKEQLAQLPEDIQAGIAEEKEGIVSRFVRGTREGREEAALAQEETIAEQQAGEIGTARAFAENISNTFNQMFTPITRGIEEAVIEPALETAGDITGAVVGEENWEEFKASLPDKVSNIKDPMTGVTLGEAAQPFFEFYDGLDDATKRELGLAGESIENLFTLVGLGTAPKAVTTLVKSFKSIAPKIAKQTDEGLEALAAAVGTKVDDISDDIASQAVNIVNSTNKVKPNQISKFQQMTKQNPGEWLVERGIISDTETTLTKLADRFAEAKKTMDDAIAKIGGTYSDKSVKKALDELEAFYKATDNRSGLSVTKKRMETLADEGLTMKQIQNVKRDLERNVKVNYMKGASPDSEKVTRLTNIDSDIREFFNQTAKERGFNNIRDLSLEIRDSRFLLDAIGDKYRSQLPNNLLGLTDNMFLAAGAINPSALAGLGIKKTLSNAKVKSWIAQAFAEAPKKADLPEVPTKRIELKSRQQRLGAAEESALNKPSDFNQAATPKKSTGTSSFIQDAKAGNKTLVIDSDEIKKTLPGFTAETAPKFHAESSRKARELFKEALDDPGYDEVILMAGGSGSGKTEAFVAKNLNRPNTIIFDGTLADKGKAVKTLEQALESGKDVKIEAVIAPIEDAWGFAKNRARVVPEEVFVDKHLNVRKTLYELAKEYPELNIGITANSLEGGQQVIEFSSRKELLDYLKEQVLTREDILKEMK